MTTRRPDTSLHGTNRARIAAAARSLLALSAVTLLATVHPAAQAVAPLDEALIRWTAAPAAGSSIRVLVRTRSGAAARLHRRLQSSAASVRSSTTPDLLIATVTPSALAAIARDPDVVRISSDAPVVGMAAKKT